MTKEIPNMRKTIRDVALLASVLGLVACGSAPNDEPTNASQDSLCTQTASQGPHFQSICNSSGGTSSGGGGGGGGTTYTTSCSLIMGSGASSTYALPYNTQVAPSGVTGLGWTSYSRADIDNMTRNLNAYCKADPTGILCALMLVTYGTIVEMWVFENKLADALQAVTGVDPTTSAPLLLNSGDPNAALHAWSGVEMTAAQAYNPTVQNVMWTYGNDPNTSHFVVHPQLFQCTRTNNSTGSSTTRYYAAWDPNCSSGVNCSTPLLPRGGPY